jgi:hypothetical protein
MANIFQKSFQDLLQELRTEAALKSGEPDPTAGRYGQPSSFLSPTQGRLLQAGEPAPTPYGQPMPRATTPAQAPVLPPGYVSPTNQAAMAAGQRVPQPGGPAPGVVPVYDVSRMPTMQPTGNVSGNVAPNMPPVIPVPPQSATAATAQPAAAQPAATQQGGGQPFSYMGEEGLNIPEKVTTKIERPTHSEIHSIQAKPPKQTGEADYRNVVDPDARYLHAAAAAQGGGAPAGPAPAVPTAPAVRPAQPASQATGPWTYGAPPGAVPQGQGQNVNFQVPAHPGLLERIGQTISHFFGGTLGQHQQPQQPASPYRPGYGPPEGNALSGVSRALASGRQHVTTRGGSAPASAAAPTPNLASTQPLPLEDTNVGITPEGQAYRADITNPLAYRTYLTPPAGAIGMVTDPQTGQRHWVDKDKKIIQ